MNPKMLKRCFSNLNSHCLIMMNDFSDCSVLSWNVRGAGSHEGRYHVKNLTHKYRSIVFIVIKTHIPFSKAVNFWKGLGYKEVTISETNGHGGGIWVLEENGNNYCDVMDIHNQMVTYKISKG